MQRGLDHVWDLSWDEARQVQESLAGQVSLVDAIGTVRTVAGIDLAYPRTATGVVVGRAGIVVLTFPGLAVIEEHVVTRPVTFPYRRGLLSFREAPIALAAVAELHTPPDLLMIDGHGIAHPRRFGVASHLGVLLDLPTIGCARSILTGQATEPGQERGDVSPLTDGYEVLGLALRTRPRSRPLYVSPGHGVSIATATSLVMQCTRGYRLPEPTRLAGLLASRRD